MSTDSNKPSLVSYGKLAEMQSFRISKIATEISSIHPSRKSHFETVTNCANINL